MRKLKLNADALTVDTFEPIEAKGGGKGTVHAHATDGIDGCTVDVACTRDESCLVELCPDGTNERACYTPYHDCQSVRWVCATQTIDC